MEKPRRPEDPGYLEWAVVNLVSKAYESVRTKYGPESRHPLPYHSFEHTNLVVRSADQLAHAANKNGKIKYREIQLLRIAAAHHDIIQDTRALKQVRVPSPGGAARFLPDEHLSAEAAARNMSDWNIFSDDETNRVTRIILATKLQEASPEIGIRQSPDTNDYLTLLMVDADTSSLGAPVEIYWDMAQRFFAEENPELEFSRQVFSDFVERQKGMVANHKFQTEEARQLFNHQAEILEFLDKVRP